MATRQEIQIALDLIKHVNVPNDLLLSAAVPVAKGEIKVTDGALGAQTQRDMTVAEQKQNLARLAAQVKGYRQKCESFLSVPANRALAETGLTTLGMAVKDLEDDIAIIKTVAARMATAAAKAKTIAALTAVGKAVETDAPAMPLVRKG